MPRRIAPGFRCGASFRARFSPNGQHLVTLGQKITLWSVASRERIAKAPPFPQAAWVDFSPRSNTVVAKNTSGDVFVLGVPGMEPRAGFSGKDYGEGAAVRFGPGDELVDATWSGRLLVRDARTGAVLWEEPGGDIFELVCTRDRRTWAYTRWSRQEQRTAVFIREWPFDTNDPHPVPNTKWPQHLAISDSANHLAVAGNDLFMFERLQRSGEWIQTAKNRHDIGARGRTLSFSPNGELLAATGRAQAAVFTSELEHHLSEDLQYNCDVDFSPHGQFLAIGDWSSGVVLHMPSTPTSAPHPAFRLR